MDGARRSRREIDGFADDEPRAPLRGERIGRRSFDADERFDDEARGGRFGDDSSSFGDADRDGFDDARSGRRGADRFAEALGDDNFRRDLVDEDARGARRGGDRFADDDGFAEATPRSAKSSGKRGARREKAQGVSNTQTDVGGDLLWMGVFATLVWIAGVGAFIVGHYNVPVSSVSALMRGVSQLGGATKLVAIAAMIAPIGLIWLTVSLGRRTAALTNEVARLRSTQSGSDGSFDPSVAAAEVGRAARGLADVEQALEAAEERARRACEKLEDERTALTQLVQDFEADARRITDAFDEMGRGGGESPAMSAFARAVADAISSGGGAPEQTPRLEAPRRDQFAEDDAPPPSRRASRLADEIDSEIDDPFSSEAAPRSRSRERPSSASDPRARPTRRDRFDREAGRDLSERRELDAPKPLASDDIFSGGHERRHIAAPDAHEAVDEPRRRRDAPPPPALAEPAAPTSDLDWSKLVRAANFPDSEDDRETLDALYAVLADPEAAALLQSAEDALSSLADLGLYMEDLKPEHAPLEAWRSFILHGDRRDAEDLGGVRDPHALSDVTAALGSNAAFGDVAERFMERFESMVERLFAEAPDTTITVELADTRTGRAYMLIGRASGRFT